MTSPATSTPPADTGFDPLVFWFHHKNKILILVALLALGLASWGISEYARTQNDAAAQDMFAKADSADAYRKVISQYSSSKSAASAYLMLGQKLREEGKFD